MANRRHVINLHTSASTVAPGSDAGLMLGEIAVQHTPDNPAIWIKMGSGETSEIYEKFIGQTEILELINNSNILGSGYTYSGLPYVNSSTTIADAFSAITSEVIKDERVTAAAINDLNTGLNRVKHDLADDEYTIALALNDLNDRVTSASGACSERLDENEEIVAGLINILSDRIGTVETRMTGDYIPITGYELASGTSEEELSLSEEDTVNEAFGKLQKQMLDNEEAIAAGFNDVNARIGELEEEISHNTGVTVLSGVVKTLSSTTASLSGAVEDSFNDLYDNVLPNYTQTGDTQALSATVMSISAKTSGILTLNLNGVEQGVYSPSADTTINLEAIQEITGADVLLTGYELASGSTEEELVVLATDSVNQAFGKLQKQNYDNEAVVAGALNDLDERIAALETSGASAEDIEALSGIAEDHEERLDVLEISAATNGDLLELSGAVQTKDFVIAAALNDLNSRIVELSGNTDVVKPLSASTIALSAGTVAAIADLEDKIDELSGNTGFDGLEEITWSALKTLRDSSGLTPGKQYRITDYNTTTSQEYTQAAGHQFDIIVVADSANKLNENARAVLHDGDTYFSTSGANLNAWEIKYSLDNDDKRFYWAVTGSTGRGVIYYMKDEWNNECPYDFKNIQFKRKLTDGQYDTGGVETFVYTFNAYDVDNGTINDASIMVGRDVLDDGTQYCFFNVIKSYVYLYRGSNDKLFRLNDIVFLNLFSLSEGTYFECYHNVFGNDCSSNTFGTDCYSNTFGNGCYSNTFGNGFRSNIFGNGCYSNTFGNGCSSNTFGNGCSSNAFGNTCAHNTFGNNCSYNRFGNNCYSNTFGNGCDQIIFNKDYVQNVIVENGNQYITLTSTQTPTDALPLRNIAIAQGVNNSTTRKTISHDTLNDTFKTTYQSADSQVINI